MSYIGPKCDFVKVSVKIKSIISYSIQVWQLKILEKIELRSSKNEKWCSVTRFFKALRSSKKKLLLINITIYSW